MSAYSISESQFNTLMKKLESIENKLNTDLDLTKRNGVKAYLGVSESTLNRMLVDGRFREGIHFTRAIKENKNIIIWYSDAIKKLKG